MNIHGFGEPRKARTITLLLRLFVAAAVITPAFCHEGVPVDPSITEDSPRKYSKLYLERKDLPWATFEDGIEVQEVREGKGAAPYKGAMVYVMWRMFDKKDGREIFYRTKHRTDKFFYGESDADAIGGGGTLRAVELALKDMREGGKRMLAVASDKAFGKAGWSDSHFVVPPDMDIVLEISLLWVRDPNPKRFTPGEPFPRPSQQLEPGKEDTLGEFSEKKDSSEKTAHRAPEQPAERIN